MDFLIVSGLAAFILGLSKGGMPVVAVLSVPLMALFMDPALAAGLLLPLYLAADCYAVYLFRRSYSLKILKILVLPAIGGLVAGYFAVAHVPGDAVKLLLALIALSYLANAIWKRSRGGEVPARPADLGRGVIFGSLAGLTSYIAHSGGPPYQAYVLPQKLEKMTYLGTTTIFFAALNLMKVPPYILAGQITWDSVAQSVWLVPFAFLGAWSGARISRWLPQRVFFALIETALALVAIRLLYEVFAG